MFFCRYGLSLLRFFVFPLGKAVGFTWRLVQGNELSLCWLREYTPLREVVDFGAGGATGPLQLLRTIVIYGVLPLMSRSKQHRQMLTRTALRHRAHLWAASGSCKQNSRRDWPSAVAYSKSATSRGGAHCSSGAIVAVRTDACVGVRIADVAARRCTF
ncbi:hypothetical protein KC19_VG018800 [Ceratodon purpureus]|uniref:Secreted protein n=1 Tax=Ceratodon purpureus TaxID=3225 RepID=A0A8T0HL51_CERPU|nr:hypothetical protein KC19_VG018800 [Ceratodon purpureus]